MPAPKKGKHPRVKTVTFRLSEPEHKFLMEKAEEHKLSVSDLIMKVLEYKE